jgi:hypothetical protein
MNNQERDVNFYRCEQLDSPFCYILHNTYFKYPWKIFHDPAMDRSPDIISLLFSFDLWKPIKRFGAKDNANLVMLLLKTNFHKLPTSLIFPPLRKKKPGHDVSTNPYSCMNDAYIRTHIIITRSTSLLCNFIVHMKPIKKFLEMLMKEIPTGSEVPQFNGN